MYRYSCYFSLFSRFAYLISTFLSLQTFLLCNSFLKLIGNTHQFHTRLHSFLWQIKDTVFCHRSFCQGFNGLSNQLKSFFHCCNSFHFLVLTFFISSVPLGTLLVYSAIAEKSRGFAMNIHISQKLVIHAEVTLKGEVGLCMLFVVLGTGSEKLASIA